MPKCRARKASREVRDVPDSDRKSRRCGERVSVAARMVRRAADSHDQIARELSVIELTVIIHDVKPVLMHQLVLQHESSLYFRSLHSRTLNTLNKSYLLPVDQDEIKVNHKYFTFRLTLTHVQRSDIHHRLLQFVFSGRNYIGPVKEALQFGQHRRGRWFRQQSFLFSHFKCDLQSSTWGQVLVPGRRSPCDILISLLTSIGQSTLRTNFLGQRSLLLISPQYNLSTSS
jgi:hypothetical protein